MKGNKMDTNNSTNKMADMPVNKLMLNMGIPIILSMMMQALYNIVDSIFVGRMPQNGTDALNALTLAFPVQMLMVAVGIGTGVGTNALLSLSLGQKNPKKAGKVAGNALTISACIYVIFLLFGLFGVRAYTVSQTSDPLIQKMVISYLTICCTMSIGIVFFAIFEKMLQATGNSNYSTISQISGAVINIVLDPILIYGMFGIPEMGVIGAAVATVIGQIASALLGLLFHIKKNKMIPFKTSYLVPDVSIIKGIYSIGLPAIIAQALMSFMTYGMNIILGSISANAVTAYGLFYKIQQFILFAAFGLRDAITPIVSFNYGRKDRERVRDGIKYGLIYTIIIMAAGMIALLIFADAFAAAFGLSGEAATYCISAIRVISLSFIFAGINVAYQGIFQALEGGFQSLVLSVLRQFLFVLPVAYIFSKIVITNPDMIWLVWSTFIIAEVLTVIVGTLFLHKIRADKKL